ncbi:hypothetical protein Tco_0032358 [Tanacetum coccineum]
MKNGTISKPSMESQNYYEVSSQIEQENEREAMSIKEKSRRLAELIRERKKFFAAQRAEAIRNKPPTKTQRRNQMIQYLKNMAGYSHAQLKDKSFDEVQKLFEKHMKWINSFVPMEEDLPSEKVQKEESSEKKAKGSNIKKSIGRKRAKYTSCSANLLSEFDKEDLVNLWKLVKAKHGDNKPEEDFKRVLWGDLRVMFEPYVESEVWRSLQGYKRYPLTPITITNMLNKKLQAYQWNEMVYQLLKLMIQKMNIKFRGGLLGLKGFLKLLLLSTGGTKVNAVGLQLLEELLLILQSLIKTKEFKIYSSGSTDVFAGCFFLASLAAFAEVLSLLPLVVGGVFVLSDPTCFFFTLAFIFGGSALELFVGLRVYDVILISQFIRKCAPYKTVCLQCLEATLSVGGFHEDVYDDLVKREGVVHLITLLDILVLYLINEIFPQKKIRCDLECHFVKGRFVGSFKNIHRTLRRVSLCALGAELSSKITLPILSLVGRSNFKESSNAICSDPGDVMCLCL